MFQAEISSFALRLAGEGKAAKTIRTYTEAVQWFAAARLTDHDSRAGWEQVSSRDIQRWMAWLLDSYSPAYASNQYRALQQFFKWLAAEDQLPDPMAGLAPPRVTARLVPVFTSGELARLEHACAGQHADEYPLGTRRTELLHLDARNTAPPGTRLATRLSTTR